MIRGTFSFGIIIAVFSILACATVPERRETPHWVGTIPPASDDGVKLVAYGSGVDQAESNEAARKDAVAQLAHTLLGRFDSQARGVPDETALLIEQISRDRGNSLVPEDRHEFMRPDGTTETYLLVHYRQSLIEEDLIRLAAVPPRERPSHAMEEMTPEETPPPRDDIFPEMQRLLATLPEDSRRAEETLQQVLARASRVVFSSSPGEIQLSLGSDPPRPITVRVAGEEGLQLAVLELEPEIDGRREDFRTSLRTGPDGIGQYRPRTPVVSGITRIRFQPAWLEREIGRWRETHDSARIRAGLDTLEDRLSTTASLRVTSVAQGIPTAVILIDRDIAGNPIGARDAARGAFQQFQDLGYRAVAVDLSTAAETALSRLENPGVTDLYDILPFDLLASVERVVLGTAGIAQFNEAEGVTVVLDVRVYAFDLRRDERLATAGFEERVTGRDARATLRSAFNSAGRRAARQIAPRLP